MRMNEIKTERQKERETEKQRNREREKKVNMAKYVHVILSTKGRSKSYP